MMEVYDANEDGDLIEYLRGFAKENAKAIKERSERGIADLPAKSNEEEARVNNPSPKGSGLEKALVD